MIDTPTTQAADLFAHCSGCHRVFENEALMARFQAKTGGHD